MRDFGLLVKQINFFEGSHNRADFNLGFMNHTIVVLLFILTVNVMEIFDFSKNSSLENWFIINDNVMGGVSRSNFVIDENGNALFSGSVSLKNNGGFCSVRYSFEKMSVSNFEKVSLRIKGDGKKYQFRIKENRNDYYSHIAYFKTSGNWETIEIPLKDMYPVLRGRKLNMPNFSGDAIEEVGFLIGNKKEETFELEIDKIELK